MQLQPGELITAVRLPLSTGQQGFMKIGTRGGPGRPVLTLALVVDPATRLVNCALGGHGPVAARVDHAGQWLMDHVDWDAGAIPDPSTYQTFARLVAEGLLAPTTAGPAGASTSRIPDEYRRTGRRGVRAARAGAGAAALGLARAGQAVSDQGGDDARALGHGARGARAAAVPGGAGRGARRRRARQRGGPGQGRARAGRRAPRRGRCAGWSGQSAGARYDRARLDEHRRRHDHPARAPGRPPLLGEHTQMILDELGYSQPEISELRRQGTI